MDRAQGHDVLIATRHSQNTLDCTLYPYLIIFKLAALPSISFLHFITLTYLLKRCKITDFLAKQFYQSSRAFSSLILNTLNTFAVS
jgi:hypothetical protein